VLIIEQKAKGAIVRRLDRRLYGVILPQFGGLVIVKGIGALAQDVDAVTQRAPALFPRVRAGGAAPGELAALDIGKLDQCTVAQLPLRGPAIRTHTAHFAFVDDGPAREILTAEILGEHHAILRDG